jgi:EAL domain-containing protein (putative c-di-GMP-specific phosphodiesterase class I)
VEGIESAEQLSMLRDLGFDRAQGYYLGKPATHGEVEAFLSIDPVVEPEPVRTKIAAVRY